MLKLTVRIEILHFIQLIYTTANRHDQNMCIAMHQSLKVTTYLVGLAFFLFRQMTTSTIAILVTIKTKKIGKIRENASSVKMLPMPIQIIMSSLS